MATEPTQHGPAPKHLGLIWIKCSHAAISIELEEALKAQARVHRGQTPPMEGPPSFIVLCSNGEEHEYEDIASEVRPLRALAPNVPIMVLGSRLDVRCAVAALEAGAAGFIHGEMQPNQIVTALALVGVRRRVRDA